MNDFERLKNWLIKTLPDDYDKFDLEAEYDSQLTLSENQNIIEQKLSPLIKKQLTKNEIKAFQERETHEKFKAQLQNTPDAIKHAEWIKKVTAQSQVFVILGTRRSGKTALGFHLADLHHAFTKRPVFAYNFPRPELLPAHIKTTDTIESLPVGSVVIIDESGIEFNQFSFNKKATIDTMGLIKIAGHTGLTLIFITQHGGFLTKDIRRLVDVFLLKAPSLTQLYEETGMIKKLYEECNKYFEESSIARQKGYYIVSHDLKEMAYNDLPTYWNEQISKAYSQGNKKTPPNTSWIMQKWNETFWRYGQAEKNGIVTSTPDTFTQALNIEEYK